VTAVDDRTVRGPRLLRGVVTATLSTLLIAVGHVLAGGAVPDLTVLVVLFPLLTTVLVGVADRCRSTAASVATLGAGQYALHIVLGMLHSHPADAADPVAMVAGHAVATLVVAVFLRHADQALVAAGDALRRVLPRRPFVPPADGPLRPLRVAGPARALRSLTLAAVPARRGPPVGC
jgi:hypothetical protein